MIRGIRSVPLGRSDLIELRLGSNKILTCIISALALVFYCEGCGPVQPFSKVRKVVRTDRGPVVKQDHDTDDRGQNRRGFDKGLL